MIKNLLFATALFSLALATGCAKGGNGPCVSNCPSINVTDSNGDQLSLIGLNLQITLTANVMNISPTAVNWSITGASCTGSGSSNPCGYFTSTSASTANYQAPSSVPSNASISIVATLQSNSSITGSMSSQIVPVTTAVAPAAPSVGKNLIQEFTAVALPDNAPQTFTWTCTANGSPCASFMQDANVSGLAYYAGEDTCSSNGCVQISAAATIDPTGCSSASCTGAKVTPVSSRLTGNSTKPVPFAFHFSGYDTSGKQVLVTGTFTATNGAITSGVEDEIAWNGSQYAVSKGLTITSGTYSPAAVPNSSNNAGVLTLNLPTGVYPDQFQAVLDSAGDMQMIESDGQGNGSGIAEPTGTTNQFNNGSQTYVFGFSGVDSSGNRVGYAGLAPMNGTATIISGEMDINDNGSTSNICGTAPCTIAGSYSYNSSNNTGQLTLISAVTMDFDFFIANGTANANTPLTIYAISTDPVDAQHPAVLGTLVLQDSGITYNNAAFNGTSVSALMGLAQSKANVSLTLGTTDGNGNFSGQFDQNNAGTILSAVQFPPATGSDAYTYTAASSSNGRYVFQMLGNPSASPVVAPIPFVVYASGANRGFLLDQSSTSVMTGTMNPQPSKLTDDFAPSELPGTYALATNAVSNSTTASIAFIASNLLLTSTGNQTYNVNGTQNPGGKNITGSYSMNLNTGTGTIVLTSPGTPNYVYYMVDLTHFFMFDADSGVSSALFYAEE